MGSAHIVKFDQNDLAKALDALVIADEAYQEGLCQPISYNKHNENRKARNLAAAVVCVIWKTMSEHAEDVVQALKMY
jgi:hypothetical protein